MTPERRREIKAKYREAHREELRAKGREYAKRKRAENPDAGRVQMAEWRKNNRERWLESVRKQRAANPEKSREACRKWYWSHRDYDAERKRKWLQAHPEYNRAKVRARRAMEYNAPGSHTQQELDALLKKQGNKCPDCKAKFTKRNPPTLDHVIPITRGGSEFIDNLRWVCKSCNSKKYNKPPEEWAAKNGLLFC